MKKNKCGLYVITLTNEEVYKEYQKERKKEMMSNNLFIKTLIENFKKRRKDESVS